MTDKTVLEKPYKSLDMVDGRAVMAPEDYQDPKVLYDNLIQRVRKYHPSDDISLIEKAFDIAYRAHEGQCRKSGEEYIIHPLWVATILADLELDVSMLDLPKSGEGTFTIAYRALCDILEKIGK